MEMLQKQDHLLEKTPTSGHLVERPLPFSEILNIFKVISMLIIYF